MSPDWIRSRWK